MPVNDATDGIWVDVLALFALTDICDYQETLLVETREDPLMNRTVERLFKYRKTPARARPTRTAV